MGGSPGSWLTAEKTGEHILFKTKISLCTKLQNKGDYTHTAERFVQTTSATAAARTGPTPRAQRDSEVSRHETGMPPLPQTEP